ncbi:hypothetical protein DQM68_07365 [Leptospira mayottensis]|uniref:DUF1564 family protein n=1 Tax=Leptospira mayottensis TaxID=1137606 RepID=A0ABM6YEQ7_9LEPT|nr:hypothetical protein DQM68_07365 [Leptospira mayottensis]AXR66103.1 hypothetical protein DQM28_09045 [Leptospira mayottensis]
MLLKENEKRLRVAFLPHILDFRSDEHYQFSGPTFLSAWINRGAGNDRSGCSLLVLLAKN